MYRTYVALVTIGPTVTAAGCQRQGLELALYLVRDEMNGELWRIAPKK